MITSDDVRTFPVMAGSCVWNEPLFMTFWAKHKGFGAQGAAGDPKPRFLNKKRITRVLLLGLVMAFPLLMMRVPAVRQALVNLVAFMRESPPTGIAMFVLVEAFALALTAPTWLMSGLVGYAYGFVWGFVVAWPALMLAVSAVFLLGRTFAKKLVQARSAESHFWKAVDAAAKKDGFKLAMLMRLAVALPQNLVTYMLSATSIRMRDFLAGSMLGYLPATIVHVYVGSSVDSIAAFVAGQSSNRGPWAWVTAAVGFGLTVSAMLLAARYARRALDEALADAARQNA